MGVWDTITELIEAAAPWSVAEAEAEEAPEDSNEGAEEEDSGDEEEEEEEEDEDEEPVDPKDELEEECKNSKACAPAKHHFEECVERVENGSKEDCVEESPKLWAKLK